MTAEAKLKQAILRTSTWLSKGMSESQATEFLSKGMNLFGPMMLEQISDSDEPTLFVPVGLVVNSKKRPGCLMTLDDRLALAWIVGFFRPKRFCDSIAYSSITEVTADKEPASGGAPEMDRLTVHADSEWTILFREAGPLPKLVHGVLTGSVTFEDAADQA